MQTRVWLNCDPLCPFTEFNDTCFKELTVYVTVSFFITFMFYKNHYGSVKTLSYERLS